MQKMVSKGDFGAWKEAFSAPSCRSGHDQKTFKTSFKRVFQREEYTFEYAEKALSK
jgi:hypothetical protein